ncbi:MAG: glycosyltransferase family 39 protein [Eubacteriales bacterium]
MLKCLGNKDENNGRKVYLHRECLLVKAIIFLIFLASAVIMMIHHGNLSSPAPDEGMRYQLIEYLYTYGKLPHGGDPELQTAWGFSYAFLPYLSAIVSAIFMKITSLFTQDAHILLLSARSVSVLCGCIAVIYIFKIADKLFHTAYKWVFVSSIVFLPQLVYISSYLNNDIAGFMSITMIVYYWILGSEKNWNKEAVVGLSIGLSICILSYYNDYGFVLMSVVFYFADQIKKKTPKLKMFQIAGCISLLCFCMAGWFFLYNAYLYDGDFLGLATMMEYKETYAIQSVQEQITVQESGQSVWHMLWNQKWLLITTRSFIAMFGSMDILVSRLVYMYYRMLFLVGVTLYGIHFIRAYKKKEQNKYLFEVSLLIGGMTAIFLSIYNSYTNDFQAQGRYIVAFLLPLVFFVTKGMESFKLVASEKISYCVAITIGCLNALILLYCCFAIFI